MTNRNALAHNGIHRKAKKEKKKQESKQKQNLMIISLDCSTFNVKPHINKPCVHVSDITKNKLSRTQQFISRILWQDCYGLCPSSLSSRHSAIISTSKIGVPNERLPKLWWHALLSNWNQWVSNQNTQELMPRLKKKSFVLYNLS